MGTSIGVIHIRFHLSLTVTTIVIVTVKILSGFTSSTTYPQQRTNDNTHL